MNYTTQEQEIGTYLGKKYYQKTVVYGDIHTGNTSIGLSTGIANVEKIFVDYVGSQINDILPFPYIHPGDGITVGYFFEIASADTTIQIRSGNETKNALTNTIITFRYTKTTD